jgi:hypothetical protein
MIVSNLYSIVQLMLMIHFEDCYLFDEDYSMNNQMIVENYNYLDDDHDQNDFLLK